MKKPFKATSKILAVLLSVVLLMGILPSAALASGDLLSATSGTGWDEFGGESINSGIGNIVEDWASTNESTTPPIDDKESTVIDAAELQNADDKNTSDPASATSGVLKATVSSSGVLEAEIATSANQPALGESGTELISPEQFNKQFMAYQEWAAKMQNSRARFARAGGAQVSTSQITLGGEISWPSGDPSRPYFISGTMPKIQVNGQIAFCGEFNGQNPTGNYSLAGTESDSTILQILANYDASPSDAAYVAAQVAIWQHITTGKVNLKAISWGGAIGASAGSSIFNGSADYSSFVYELYKGGAQDVIKLTYASGTEDKYRLKIIKKNENGSKVISGAVFSVSGPNGFNKANLKTDAKGEYLLRIQTPGTYTVTETKPPAGYLLSSPASQTVNVTKDNTPTNPATVTFNNPVDETTTPGKGEGETKTETSEKTETVVKNSKEYSYSDAIGQITIRKHDQDGNSLDGAQFNIRVDFTSGSPIVVDNWEVDNGARLFTYTHPSDNHYPATVTVTEVQPPRHYDLDPTPKTAVIHPTYTRVTQVKTWTETITTITTNVTVVKDGQTIDENSSEATATTTSTPQVEEFTDFIAGDRDITVTFTNTRQTGDIIVTKRDANTGLPLAGASIHLWGEDLDDNTQSVDMTLTTDENGEAKFEFLPPGTYAVQETQAPYGYNLDNSIQNAVLQSNQVVRVEVRNYRKDGLFIKKVDQDGKPLQGATFELRRGSGEELLSDVTSGYRQEIVLKESRTHTINVENAMQPSITITKKDKVSGAALAGATFRISWNNGADYRDVTTNHDDRAVLTGLNDGWYSVVETKAPDGYNINTATREVNIEFGQAYKVEFVNFSKPGLRILKLDSDTKKHLGGTKFKVAKASGEAVGEYTTDNSGLIQIEDLPAGENRLRNPCPAYIVRRTQPAGK